MPPKTQNAKPGDLLRYRLQIGTFYFNATRKIVRILNPGERFIVEGKGDPIVELKDILSVLTTIPATQ